MQVVTTKEQLAAPLSMVCGAADAQGAVPILGMVLLKASETGKLSMLCSDSGVLARSLADAEVKGQGEIAVDVRRFHDLVRAMPEKQSIEISIDTGKEALLVKSGRSRFRLPTMSASEYPRMASAKGDRLSVTMDARRLAEMISEVSDFMGVADVRYFLNGALFLLDSKGLWLVATDGHRMAVSHEPIEGIGDGVAKSVVVPRKTVLLAKKALSQGKNVTLSISEKSVQFSLDDGSVLFGNSIDGTYPDWRVVIPSLENAVVFEGDSFLNSLAMIVAASDGKERKDIMASKVELAVSQKSLKLRRDNEGVCEIDAASTSDSKQSMFFNSDYLIGAIRSVGASSKKISIGFGGATSSIIVKPEGKDYPMAVVMPLRN